MRSSCWWERLPLVLGRMVAPVAPLPAVGVKLHPSFALLKEKWPLQHPEHCLLWAVQGCWGDPSQTWRWQWPCCGLVVSPRPCTIASQQLCEIVGKLFPYWVFYCVQLLTVGENKPIKVPPAFFKFCTWRGPPCFNALVRGVSTAWADTVWPNFLQSTAKATDISFKGKQLPFIITHGFSSTSFE